MQWPKLHEFLQIWIIAIDVAGTRCEGRGERIAGRPQASRRTMS